MATTAWGDDKGPNFELWDELYWVVAQWVCQQRARIKDLEATHIDNPAAYNRPCDWCYDVAFHVLEGGLRELFQAFGSVAYSCGTKGVPEHEAAHRALRATIDRSSEIERTKELLAQLTG